jgi:hypothetical protein
MAWIKINVPDDNLCRQNVYYGQGDMRKTTVQCALCRIDHGIGETNAFCILFNAPLEVNVEDDTIKKWAECISFSEKEQAEQKEFANLRLENRELRQRNSIPLAIK